MIRLNPLISKLCTVAIAITAWIASAEWKTPKRSTLAATQAMTTRSKMSIARFCISASNLGPNIFFTCALDVT